MWCFENEEKLSLTCFNPIFPWHPPKPQTYRMRFRTLRPNRELGSIQWTNTFDFKMLKYIIKMIKKCHFGKYSSLHKAIYQPTSTNFRCYNNYNITIVWYYLKIGAGWLTYGFVQARIFPKVAFFLSFLWYILTFWSQKCWFIELNLPHGSDAVCSGTRSVTSMDTSITYLFKSCQSGFKFSLLLL